MILLETAQQYIAAGLCTLPADKARKFPTVGKWTPYKTRLPNSNEIDAWFANAQTGLCVVCGTVSGNLEMIDFDNGGELFDAWIAKIPDDLFDRLMVESTQSGGWHVVYRCESEICGNVKLAQRAIDNGVITLIETRGQGGLFLCAPTDGYKLLQGELTALPVLTKAERELLMQAAVDLDEIDDNVPKIAHNAALPSNNTPLSADYSNDPHMPGGDFNIRGDIRPILEKHGWAYIGKSDGNELWRRPGKDHGTQSATFKEGCFFVHSTNAYPFEHFKGNSKFKVYTILEHGGDFSASTRDLSAQGYGNTEAQYPDVDISAIVKKSADASSPKPLDSHIGDSEAEKTDGDKEESFLADARDAAELCKAEPRLHRPIIHGLLREGETMNIIAAPKMGKSWMSTDQAMAVALGNPWFGMFETVAGNVLIIDNELHPATSAKRLRDVAAGRGIDTAKLSGKLFVKNLRGSLKDLYGLGRFFAEIEPGRYKLIILDAFYRFMPSGSDENDNGTMANLYNHLDLYAARLGCAFVLIHHTTKGSQSGKKITDVGAGAGAQARATDTHLVLRNHKEPGIVVLDAAVRSWPPLDPVCLRWDFPVWNHASDFDAEELEGARKKKAKPDPNQKSEMTAEEFVHRFVPAEPVVKTVINECARAAGLSGRQFNAFMAQAENRNLMYRYAGPANRKHKFSRNKPPPED
ncbi:MAG: AAA family ATPase [Anaerohalosphaeraceae bacterium]|nr:AAA family ATPase [Anaerohalosphaeraceae bacterium]